MDQVAYDTSFRKRTSLNLLELSCSTILCNFTPLLTPFKNEHKKNLVIMFESQAFPSLFHLSPDLKRSLNHGSNTM